MKIKKLVAVAISMLCITLTSPLSITADDSVSAEIEVWNGTYDTSWYDEEEIELHISTAEDLAGLSKLVNAGHTMEGQTIYLDNDIYLNDVSDYDNWSSDVPLNNWISIGYDDSTPFAGIFDGQGNTITGLYQYERKCLEPAYAGLFGYLTGCIRNVICKYAYIETCTYDTTKRNTATGYDDLIRAPSIYAGGICGYADNGEISNYLVNGYIRPQRDTKYSGNSINSGGICGCLNGENANISNCGASGYIYGSEAGGISGEISDQSVGQTCSQINNCYSYCEVVAYYAGGSICGAVYGKGTIKNCYNQGYVKGNSYSGGIVGYAHVSIYYQYLTISNVYNVGTIEADKYKGGIFGTLSKTSKDDALSLEACYYLNGSALRGVGMEGDDYTISKNSANMQKESFVESLGDAFVYNEGGYPLLAWEVESQQEHLMGDVNLDGTFDIADIKLLQDYLLCRETLTAEQGAVADVCADNILNCFDLCVLKRMYLEQSQIA